MYYNLSRSKIVPNLVRGEQFGCQFWSIDTVNLLREETHNDITNSRRHTCQMPTLSVLAARPVPPYFGVWRDTLKGRSCARLDALGIYIIIREDLCTQHVEVDW